MKTKNKLLFLSITLFTLLQSCQKKTEEHTQDETRGWTVLHEEKGLHLRGLSPISENVAWASGVNGSILRTADGGKTWEKFSVNGADSLDFRDIEAFDDQTAIAITAGSPAKIYKTTNAGKEWALSYLNEDRAIFMDAMGFWDNQNGIAFGDPMNGHLKIITTADGGKTWTDIPSENIPQANEMEGGFAASGSCLVVEGDSNVWIGTGGAEARVYFSTNRGKTWTITNTPIRSGIGSSGIYTLTMQDQLNGVAMGGDYTMPDSTKAIAAYTNDGGKTWQKSNDVPSGYRSCVIALKAKKGTYLSISKTGMDISTDNGLNWVNVDSVGFYTLYQAKEDQSLWASGSHGRIGKWHGKLSK
ncbi:WD40/YVTN/BNR-like repeat-containing protein [Sediminitomix flava]|uniref:Photosystem II stability/assembly factor-like uncharacterized protein n=1 Tax=Sediminitomix flava TaxID=379075 RepID=A0A316A334_SEDFL|nr:YCF48-related protein [Sediminitomix flava]PWJ44117.1 photosystem II stability/assembly factor-like uncharacterized protein [Sediminitomix flava]